MNSSGLGRFQPVIAEPSSEPRVPSQTTAELLTLHRTADQLREVADDIDPAEPEDEGDPDFGQNLAEHIPPDLLARIANDLLQGIDSDLQSRRDWETIAAKAIEFLGLIYEEASGQVSAQGSVSKVWHTLLLEASIQFWANAHAEFLPADGPVKVRDDQTAPEMGHNGGPPLEGDQEDRDTKADDFETDFNHYLTVGDKQYYRDFSRMLFSLGVIGTQFRKVYYNPLRRMAVSEWVKAENLIVSNDAVHLATAGRVTERIMMRQADVKRLQLMGWWLKQPLTDPVDTPTSTERTVGQVEGIRPGSELPGDHRHTTYETYVELDLPGFEHKDEDGNQTGLPLPYRVTLDKDSRRIHEIRRNWKEDDPDFAPRQRYVMFGLVPGLGFYFLGYAHILGNTERALTALEREVIDATMYAIFPGFLHAKGAFRGDTTQLRPSPGSSVQVNLGMKQRLQDAVMPIPSRDVSPSVMALAQKLEDNGRKLSAAVELPVGEGTANIPVGTIIAMIEEGTKVTAAVHKGMHQSRTEELELLKELIAEDPSLLSKNNRSPKRKWETAEEFGDLDLVPASDPNTPSHVHRIMRAVALGQVAGMFPDIANRRKIFDSIIRVLRVTDPDDYSIPADAQTNQPNPQALTAQSKTVTAQIQAQTKQMETDARVQTAEADRQSKERVATMEEQTERMKVQAEMAGDQSRMHDSAAERVQDVQLAREQQSHEHELERTRAAVTPPRTF